MEPITYIEDAKLRKTAEQAKDRYRSAQPFPHIYFDDFFDPAALEEVLAEFPGTDRREWHTFESPTEKKLESRSETLFGPKTKMFLRFLNSSPFLSFLQELTGIEALIPDPFFNGAGLHQIRPGGLLKVHADFNKDTRTQLDRRLNLLVYLNKDWQEDWGGHFELWDREMRSAQVKLLPVFNRVALFSTTSTSFHGHPDPLRCPEGRTRKSIALYYYTNGRPAEEQGGWHNTLFQARPGEDEGVRDQLARDEQRRRRRAVRRKLRSIAKSLVPPILLGNWDPDARFDGARKS